MCSHNLLLFRLLFYFVVKFFTSKHYNIFNQPQFSFIEEKSVKSQKSRNEKNTIYLLFNPCQIFMIDEFIQTFCLGNPPGEH